MVVNSARNMLSSLGPNSNFTSRKNSNSQMIKAASLEPNRYDRRVKATNFLKEMDIIKKNRVTQIHEIDSPNQFNSS